MVSRCEANVRRLAGIVVLTGLLLGWFVSSWAYALSAFAALNLLQSSVTDVCPAETIFAQLGLGC